MANDRTILVENGGYLTLSTDWARNILYMIKKEEKEMVRRIGNTTKIPSAPGILSETKLHFQRKIKGVQLQYNIPDELIISFDQTPLALFARQITLLIFKETTLFLWLAKEKRNRSLEHLQSPCLEVSFQCN